MLPWQGLTSVPEQRLEGNDLLEVEWPCKWQSWGPHLAGCVAVFPPAWAIAKQAVAQNWRGCRIQGQGAKDPT